MDTASRLDKIRALETQIEELTRARQDREQDPGLQRLLNDTLVRLAQERAMETERINRLHQANLRDLEQHRKRLATTVHDLKAPITISLLNLELMEMEEDPEQVQFYVTGLRRELEFMLETIGNLLELERSEEERQPRILEPVALRPLVDQVVQRMSVLIKDKPDLHLLNEVPADLPPVHANPHRLSRVLNNLFANAIKYTETGSVTVEACRLPDERAVHLTVADTGIGIEKERLPELFSYYQGDRDNPASTGIGLAFVRQVVEQHQGDVWIESERGEGTQVHVRLLMAE